MSQKRTLEQKRFHLVRLTHTVGEGIVEQGVSSTAAETNKKSRCTALLRPHAPAVAQATPAAKATCNEPPVATESNVTAPAPDHVGTASNPAPAPAGESAADVDEKLRLEHYGIPLSICNQYKQTGLVELYPWQRECLATEGVLDGQNLVYCAPTSGGKTLVAEVLMLRRVALQQKKALFVVPFVSVAAEKSSSLSRLLGSSMKVQGFYAGAGDLADLTDTDIAVCTIEKANGLMNHLIENDHGLLACLGTIVVDEVHFIADERRGYLTELLLSKVLFALGKKVQVIAMSATLANPDLLAKWLRAALYTTTYRPVGLTEYVKIGNSLMTTDFEPIRKLKPINGAAKRDPDLLLPLLQEVRDIGASTLIFCPSKKRAEDCARLVAELLPRPTECNNRSVFRALEDIPGFRDTIQMSAISVGVAYYHSGLTLEERKIIEQAFRDGHVSILSTTTGLAAGVNLPARRVIFRTAKIGGAYLSPADYKQMCGRAGRAGKDAYGESVLMGEQKEVSKLKSIIQAPMSAVSSCLVEEKRGMTKALLEVIAAGVVKDVRTIERFITLTLLGTQADREKNYTATKMGLQYLVNNKFIEYQSGQNGQTLCATRLGVATFAAGVLSPEDALFVHDELHHARDRLLLGEELHLIYLVTPLDFKTQVDWGQLIWRYEHSKSLRTVAAAVRIEEAYLHSMAQNNSWSANTVSQTENPRFRRHRRFCTAVILLELISERDWTEISAWSGVTRGDLQALQSAGAAFAGCIAKFCERYGWTDLRLLIAQFIERINSGVKQELLDLVRIPYVKAARARALHKAGMRTVEQVAQAPQAVVMDALRKATSKSNGSDEKTLCRSARLILAGAREVKSKDSVQNTVQSKAADKVLSKLGFHDEPHAQKSDWESSDEY